jgi:hypothetical protein
VPRPSSVLAFEHQRRHAPSPGRRRVRKRVLDGSVPPWQRTTSQLSPHDSLRRPAAANHTAPPSHPLVKGVRGSPLQPGHRAPRCRCQTTSSRHGALSWRAISTAPTSWCASPCPAGTHPPRLTTPR